ncbi:NADH dehydrogenase [ubiquinone] 1 alpha subcomplex subunit 11-like [Argonauta hians]
MPFESGDNKLIFKKVYLPDLYSTPDSEDLLIKSAQCSALGAYVGAGLGLLDCLRTFHHFTPSNIGLKVIGMSAPLAAIGAVYPAVTGIVAKIRNKDDPLNHAAGGFVAGSIWAIRYKNPVTGWASGLGFGIVCCVMKFCSIHGFKLYPDSLYNAPNSTSLNFNHYNRSFLATKGPILGREDDD